VSSNRVQRQELTISRSVRVVEISSVVLFFAFQILLVHRLWRRIDLSWISWAVLELGAFMLSDFISGLFHWAADTWASTNTPVIGRLFVRPFREHHVDPLAITRHDLWEVTGANCAIALPWFAVHFMDLEGSRSTAIGAAFLGSFLFFVFVTNLSHRWAHSPNPPPLAVLAHRLGLLLTPSHHAEHHIHPHTTHYCITSGWLNGLLDGMRFFRALEVIVEGLTGLVPRQDDAEVTTALTGAPPPPPRPPEDGAAEPSTRVL
jgi:ubiquitin-conjugating enzyme E2 variant